MGAIFSRNRVPSVRNIDKRKSKKKVDSGDPSDSEPPDRYVKARLKSSSIHTPSSSPSPPTPPLLSHGTVSQGDIQEAIQQGKKIIRGLYDYVSTIDPSSIEGTDLNFKKGDVMEIIDEDGDWLLAVKLTTREKGYVPNTYVAYEDSLNIFEWFHGKIGRKDAEKILTDGDSPKGTFLIRESDTVPGTYSLSVVDLDVEGHQIVKHYRIRDPGDGGCYITTKYRATSIEDLVKHHSEEATGLCHVLTRACPKMQPVTKDLSRQLRDSWEIDRSSLEFLVVLGQGNFGEVWKGRWKKVRDVAIKTMKTGSAMTKEKFLLEADVMKRLSHPKLVQLYAVCTEEEPFYIVTELVQNGNLRDYLRRDKGTTINTKILMDMALQIADGMKYIEAKNYIHRDLAARNILVGNPINMVKIGDFGLARAIDEDIYTSETGARLPIRWTALEGINLHLFTIKSDVWAFGILLVEMFTQGALPYSDLRSNKEVAEFIGAGGRHGKPDLCPDDVYEVMFSCWHKDPERRPTFETIYNQIDSPDGKQYA